MCIRDSYNTYLYPGLPVGAICNPGLTAIQAALEPSQTNYYYFMPVSYTHLGQQQLKAEDALEQHHQKQRHALGEPAAGLGAALSLGVELLLGGGEEGQNQACLLYTSRCV